VAGEGDTARCGQGGGDGDEGGCLRDIAGCALDDHGGRLRMARTETIRGMLAGGRPLFVGRAREVAELVAAQPRRVSQLIECLWDEDAGVANRAADALEKVTSVRPLLAAPWKDSLLGLLAEAKQNKLRWNLAVIVPRLTLTTAECRRAAEALRTYLGDKSSIVKTCAMQGLAELTLQDASLRAEVVDLLRILTRSGTPAIHPSHKDLCVGTPAMRARGRMLLRRLEGPDPGLVRFHRAARGNDCG